MLTARRRSHWCWFARFCHLYCPKIVLRMKAMSFRL
jgi:hypothetical protein